MQARKQHLDYLINPSFQGVNRGFVSSFEYNAHRTIHTRYFLPTVEIKDYNVRIDRKNSFDQPVKKDENKRKYLEHYNWLRRRLHN